MDRRQVGSFQASVIGLGCNNFGDFTDEAQSRRVIDAALDLGIDYFDTADIYPPKDPGRSEAILGAALGARRNKVRIATKFGLNLGQPSGRADPAWIGTAVEESLRRLQTDRIDLYQIHRPDSTTPIGDTLAALGRLVEAGKVLEIGCSNFSPVQLREAMQAARQLGLKGFAAIQNEFSVLHPASGDDVLPVCREHGVALVPFFPLASGLLTGKYRRGTPFPQDTRLKNPARWGNHFVPEKEIDAVEALIEFAQARGRTLLELAIGWVASHPGVAVVLTGATRPEQLEANARAASWAMTADEVDAVSAVVRRYVAGQAALNATMLKDKETAEGIVRG
ncbi:MAG: aldo/keto reductase [Gammaproteobacteria bacterium]